MSLADMNKPSYPSKYSEMLFNEEKLKQALTDRYFAGDKRLYDKHSWWVLTDALMEDFLQEYLGDQEMRPKGGRPFDIIVYGCSGYTGELTYDYICSKVKKDVKICLAGRNIGRVQKMKDKILADHPDCEWADIPIMKADLADPHDIRKLVLSCDCVVNIAGPFMLTGGEMLVEACVQYECDYVDVNGEVPYTYRLLEYHEIAKATNTYIVPNCAFAGGATDITSWLATQELRKRYGEKTRKLRGYISGSEGAAPSGGTLATREAMNAALKDVAHIMQNPFSLGGKIGKGDREEDQDKAIQALHKPQDPVDGFCGPFMYAFFETRVVRRSNMLMEELGGTGRGYGQEFNIQEWTLFPDEATAREMVKASTSSKDQEKALKEAGQLFAKGEGVGKEVRAKAWSKYYFFAMSDSGRKVKAIVSGGDAYEETGHVAMEVALAIVKERDSLEFKGGVLTPSTCGGYTLIRRLNDTGLYVYIDEESK